ncbi:MAG: DNA polymerase III subunit alpha [Bacteroidales bacterium]|nr:DNA polymerase III subunit alpha [Candidatus Latescibacterota bacterium]
MSGAFIHLNARSCFSMLSGVCGVEELPAMAAAAGMDAIALTDIDNMCTIVPFAAACSEAGVRPIFGVELTDSVSVEDGGFEASAVLLARNGSGYSELCRMVTSRKLDEDFSFGEALKSVSDDVYVLSSDPHMLERLAGREHLRAKLPVIEGREYDRIRWRLSDLAARRKIMTVAAGPVAFARPRDHLAHRVLTAIRLRKTVGTLLPNEAEPRGAYFRTGREIEKVFGPDAGPVLETARIASDCHVDPGIGKRRLPRFMLPPGESAAEVLRRTTQRGLRKRLGSVSEREMTEALGMLEYELSVIEGKGLADYFLICWDIVRFASLRGMRSLGRGSAGNSLVSYALGITHVNPLRHNMFFERFLNPEREQLPDFDIDFATDDREEVLQYIFRRYGEDHVAMIGTYCTLRARSAIRETAKALGIPEGEVAPLIKMIPFYSSIDRLEDLRKVSPRAADLPLEQEPLKTLLPIAIRIGGFPRHMGTHPCGLVISPEPITDVMPLQRGDKGYEITQWSMYEVEDAGLVKIDILGQKGLAVIQEAAAMASSKGEKVLHPERIDYFNDPATKALLREGKTEGCFYIESPIMMQLMRQAKCEDFEVLTALSSIIRPGVSSHGGKQSYLRRSLGLEEVEKHHPAVEAVLCDTFGCLIYQEQVIRLAVAVAGMSYAEADGLRRCMSFKNTDGETFEGYREAFMSGAARKGIPDSVATDVFDRIAAFAGYAFCKAHSASFAVESFESAWWKAHYPAEFMAAVLSNGGGYYSFEEYLEEAKRIGLTVLPPCVNESGIRHSGSGRKLRVGFCQVKGLTTAAADAIIEHRPFASLDDFLSRMEISSREVESLIRCGAMTCFGRTRPELMWELQILSAAISAGREPALTSRAPAPGNLMAAIPPLEDYGLQESLSAEREILDMCISAHPLDMYTEPLRALATRRDLVTSLQIPSMTGREIDTVGWKVTGKATRTSGKGEEMLFITFSDREGRFEGIFFPETYRKTAKELVKGRGPFHIRGKVESELGVASVIVSDAALIR